MVQEVVLGKSWDNMTNFSGWGLGEEGCGHGLSPWSAPAQWPSVIDMCPTCFGVSVLLWLQLSFPSPLTPLLCRDVNTLTLFLLANGFSLACDWYPRDSIAMQACQLCQRDSSCVWLTSTWPRRRQAPAKGYLECC